MKLYRKYEQKSAKGITYQIASLDTIKLSMSPQFARWRTHFFFLLIPLSGFLLPSLSGLLTARDLLLIVFCVQYVGCSHLREVFSDIASIASWKNMILVICTLIDYLSEDGFGRLEWSILNSRCSLYFFHCILSSFCSKTRKRDCLVAIFAAKLEVKCVLFLNTCNNTLCQWPIFPVVTIPMRFLLLQIVILVRHTPEKFKFSLLLKKYQLIFIHWSIGQLIITEFLTDWSAQFHVVWNLQICVFDVVFVEVYSCLFVWYRNFRQILDSNNEDQKLPRNWE